MATKKCGVIAPESLASGHFPLLACNLELSSDGKHTGEHKAYKTITGVGRITVRWKQSWRDSTPPPEIVLPLPTIPLARCECPDWKIGHGHVYPCRLIDR